MKGFFKSLYIYLFRLFTICKFKRFGGGSFIGPRASIKGGKKIRIGKYVRIGRFCRMQCYKDFAGEKLFPQIDIKDGCYIGDNFTALAGAPIELQENVLIASNVTISSENHSCDPTSIIPYKDQALVVGEVSIGEGTWIGQNAVILPNVKIGKKCVIAASAVVTKSVDDYSMVAGVPAKVIKKFDFEQGYWVSVKNEVV